MPTIAIDLPGPTNAPPSARRGTPKHDWENVIVRLRDRPGQWQLAFSDFTTGMFSYLRDGRVKTLEPLGGRLHMTMKRQQANAGDLWLMWTPDGWTETDQARVDAAVAAGEGVL